MLALEAVFSKEPVSPTGQKDVQILDRKRDRRNVHPTRKSEGDGKCSVKLYLLVM